MVTRGLEHLIFSCDLVLGSDIPHYVPPSLRDWNGAKAAHHAIPPTGAPSLPCPSLAIRRSPG